MMSFNKSTAITSLFTNNFKFNLTNLLYTRQNLYQKIDIFVKFTNFHQFKHYQQKLNQIFVNHQ